ncbi:MAG: hypothetical protein HYR85_18565 [Planctomycetes bacterium]|nr:hypothetical protein [Planctomycetota bacterium]MBI3843385.1 hypothetical protein [Planctomycetota bacterium]
MERTKEITNSECHVVHLWLEPWGDLIDMHPGVTFRIVVEGPREDDIELEQRDDGLTFWAPFESMLRVYEGDTLRRACLTRFPGPANSMTTRELLGLLFGKDLLRPDD